ncbi:DUF262 domain-containing protein [Methylobacterium fujisawaense]
MDVHKTPLLSVFDAKQRLEVPLFQRQYVWGEEQQWQPLWEDIERKFVEALEGNKDTPNHFLGAMVLDQKQTPTGHVLIRQVIDGQQRLTTFQIFLAAFRDFCRSQACNELADECGKFLFNTGMMANKEVDKFKVWPTQLDRAQFRDVIDSGSREEVLRRHPDQRRPYARKLEPKPRMVEAYIFFFAQLQEFFIGTEGESPLFADCAIEDRTNECFQTLRNSLMVVVIDLLADDDPQVIFETLNARGEPLLPADLLKNFIFFRAGREGINTEEAYQTYWARFDDEFWRKEVKQGRLVRPRSDLFMQHFLASQQGRDIPIKHLYVEYRHWVTNTKPFATITEELKTLARQGDAFRRIIDPLPGSALSSLCAFLEAYDNSTVYPLLLSFSEYELSDDQWREVSAIIESYLMRRAVCNLTVKGYNRIFLTITRNLRRDGFSVERLRELLQASSAETAEWPDDAAFKEAWLHKPLYGTLNNPKLVHLYARLNQTFMSSKIEKITFEERPTIEHIMPQTWVPNWLLQDGTTGVDWTELQTADPADPRVIASRKRNAAVQTLGNMTLLSSALNSAQSNLGWDHKRQEMASHSLLPINNEVLALPTWDEAAIAARGAVLFERARKIWPR